jgi:hypothetical protein
MMGGRTAFRGKLAWLIYLASIFQSDAYHGLAIYLGRIASELHAVVTELASESIDFSSPFSSSLSTF